jgi:hypothetical protein
MENQTNTRVLEFVTSKVVKTYYEVELTEEQYQKVLEQIVNENSYGGDANGVMIEVESVFWNDIPDALGVTWDEVYESNEDYDGEEVDEWSTEDMIVKLNQDVQKYLQDNPEQDEDVQ